MTEGRHAAYVRRVQEDAQRCAESILVDNERLRKRVALLEADRSGLENRLRRAEQETKIAEPLRALAASLEAEKLRLQQRLSDVEAELARFQEERASLERELAEAEAETLRAAEEYAEVQQRSADLANLYVASYQLHDAVDRAAALGAIREIVVNLVGSEEFAVFELHRDGSIALADCTGVNPAFGESRAVASRISQLARTGDVVVTPARGVEGEPPLVACVPLRVAGRVTGAIAIFSLLPHKPVLVPADREMFDLLSSQAGPALFCTRQQTAQDGAPAMT